MAEPWWICLFLFTDRCLQSWDAAFFVVYSLWGIKNSGSGSKFNCAARVGSGQTISGTGRVRASV